MRRLAVLVVAALAALTVTPPLAVADPPPGDDACPPPDITTSYDNVGFSVNVTLLASGCGAREHRAFSLSGFLDRMEENMGAGYGRVVGCGPYQSSEDMDPDLPPRTYRCELDLSMEHPAEEAAHYDVEVTYPGRSGDETDRVDLYCVSKADSASCSDETPE
jgi:hypothetical protein